ncbi:PREDICTED: protein sidekick-2-like [Amphimedon queenslandica]|uniref:Fibronectin type-III domain-containing protein n=1 Tax=Amphimedon queenslandica TaxID=400682 RepID=A0AAN0IZH2_AMPQE|nr:PREDICTED: protein sidekick-2-like [Amphimedon queenslandica]|eukprot:XP_019850169.1 PREDICTED: protein sidekick-2-like [Amphimedon queenslandica]
MSPDGPDVDSFMKFSLLSANRLATPSVFSLSFRVYDSPPTTVNCTVNGSRISIDDLSRVVMSGSASVTNVIVTLKSREAGNYQCTVSNERVSNGTINGITAMANTSSLYINVSGMPTGLKTVRLNSSLTHLRLLWSHVQGAAGYEVFCEHLNNRSISNTTTPSVTITSDLSLSATYTFYVMSYSNGASLPSNPNVATVTLTHPSVDDLRHNSITSTNIVLSWSPPTDVTPANYTICRRCHRVCGSVETFMNFTASVPQHNSTNILPYSNCAFDLIGLYGSEEYILSRNFNATTSASRPTSPVGNIIFSSVRAESMIVSWDEVPCSGRNGPITGYSLTYTSVTSNISFTVNITSGDNRTLTLTGLLPNTDYTVSISPYNYGLLGPTEIVSHRTAQSIPGPISNLIPTDTNIQFINISWNPPAISNGLITVYEIRYRDQDDTTKPYATMNTTTTQHSISGLFPNSTYAISVRAYTAIGPGQWIDDTVLSTDEIPVVHNFSVTYLNSTAVSVKWVPNGATYYRVFYYTSNCKAQFVTYPGDIREAAIGGFCSCLENEFSISASFEISGKVFEGKKSPPVLPVKLISSSSSSSTEPTATSITQSTPGTTAVSETNSTLMAAVGLWVALILLLLSLIINVVLMLVLILLCRRLVATNPRKGVAATIQYPEIRECRETDDYIEMKASPAYDKNLKVEPVYESTDEIIYETTR